MLSRYAYSQRMMSAWIKQRVLQVQKNHPERVVGIVVDKSEVQEAATNGGDFEFIKNLAQSKDFRQDLNLAQSYWFYMPETQRRTLLLQYSAKPDAKTDDLKKAIRGLGAKAAGEFHSKKCDDIEILLSDKISSDL
jgi:hypothetical protein